MKILSRQFIPVLVLVMVGTPIVINAISMPRMAAINDDPPIIVCEGGWDLDVFDEELGSLTLSSAGMGTVETIENMSDPLPSTTKQIRVFNASGEIAELGSYTWTVDDSRTEAEVNAAPSTITAASQSEDFPATATVQFYIKITFESRPDRTFRSRTPIRFFSNNITTYPFNNEVIPLSAPVEFEDSETRELQFTITGGTSTLSTVQ